MSKITETLEEMQYICRDRDDCQSCPVEDKCDALELTFFMNDPELNIPNDPERWDAVDIYNVEQGIATEIVDCFGDDELLCDQD
jgi:hypothetical protein